jgi:hypothetical protein
MYLTVVAEGRVAPIRIQRDEDLRRPYWIQEGAAKVFPAEERIVLENALGEVRLLLNGYPFPTAPNDAEGRLVITRDTAQAFADTVRGRSAVLEVTPDTIAKGQPPGAPVPEDTATNTGSGGAPASPPDSLR